MASANRVLLIGLVAAEARQGAAGCQLVVAVPEEHADRTRLERVTLIVPERHVPEAMELRLAQPLFAEGYLTRGPAGTVVVVVNQLFSAGDAPPEQAGPRAATQNHTSPRAHERAGHPRRIHLGRPDERIIWVRPSRVGGHSARAD